MDLHERLRCFGYFGFGGGYMVAQARQLTDAPGGVLYCSRCPVGEACWERHRVRARAMFPEVVEAWDRVDAEGWDDDEARIIRFCELTGQADGRPISEPYTSIMAGNMEDGYRVYIGEAPKDRGAGTLHYPLPPLA
jgi:hypothetical protein